jgi:hypothetical protein
LFAFPGPCTVFDGISTVEDTGAEASAEAGPDGEPVDAGATPVCEGGVHFVFEPSSGNCQDLIDQNCCIDEKACGQNDACAAWVDCVNRCPIPPVPRDGTCVAKCGYERDASYASIVTKLAGCRDLVVDASTCTWP